jgi:ABC-type glycerol-3-phosphate transport system substrate-binding protein
MATGWSWALTEPNPEKREMAVRLAEYLSASEFLGRWTETAGYLPPRPSALAAWQNQSAQNIFSQVVISAQVKPSNDVLTSLGPVLLESTLKVMKRESDPIKTAQAAAERVAARPPR